MKFKNIRIDEFLIGLYLAVSIPAVGQQTNCPCCTPQHTAFDFWVGDWNVYDTLGNQIGENLITKLENGCIVNENWKGAAGGSGKSYNYYNRNDSTWNQVWVASNGNSLVLKGHAEAGKMTLLSEWQEGNRVPWYANRVTWSRNPDGSVTQIWDIIDNEERVLQNSFYGIYKKKKEIAIPKKNGTSKVAEVTKSNVEPFLPELFADFPGVRDIAISPNGKEIYFTIDDIRSKFGALAFIKSKGKGKWSKPQIASFSGRFRDIEPFFSNDGNTLFFSSNRPLEDGEPVKDYDIYYVTRESAKYAWSEEPVRLSENINTPGNEYYPSQTDSGDLYFTAERAEGLGKEDIYVSRLVNGEYHDPVALPDAINSGHNEFNAFIAPDEEFIIFTSQRPGEGKGRGDLYISFKRDGLWADAELLDAVNSAGLDFCPFVDMKSRHLYFTSNRSEVNNQYKKPLNIGELTEIFTKKPHGAQRLYRVLLNFKKD